MRKIDTTNANYKNAGHRVCEACGVNYFSYNKGRKYCSVTCRPYSSSPANIARLRGMAKLPKKPRKPKFLPNNKECAHCGVAYRVKPRLVAVSKYCSMACKNAHGMQRKTTRKPRKCVVCGADHFFARKTCSPECIVKWASLKQAGEKSHRWMGGKTSEAMKIRNSQAYADWRNAVFARDDYTCLHCGQRGGRLNADHIKPFARYPELRLDVSNGQTLCFECHKQTDTFAAGADHSRQKRENGRFSA